MVFAILRILPRRSLELGFFGVDEDGRFLFVDVPVGLAFDAEDLGFAVGDSFLSIVT